MRAGIMLNRRRAAVAVAVLALSSVLFATGSPATGQVPQHLGSIALGGRIDITGEYLGTGVGDPFADRIYLFDVARSKGRLRVSLDLSNRDDCIEFLLLDPSGSVISSDEDWPFVCPPEGSGQVFDIEVSTPRAKPGTWTLLVLADDVLDAAFRGRIVFEPIRSVARRAPLRPDLVPWLPWEFGFAAPGSPNPGTANDRDNGPGDPTVSCHPEEEPEATKCLRFSAGVYNVGDGPMYIEFRDDIALQHVYLADNTPLRYWDNEARGSFIETEAGTGEWHPFHDHRHLSEFVHYELYRVDAPGELAPLSTGHKHGYCTFSQQIFDWSSTAQDPQYASYPSGIFCDDAMTLERGWGDIYRWQRPGQYLPYDAAADADGSMTAGTYLVRFTVDPVDHIVETDETNNVGYSEIEVVDGGGLGRDRVIVCGQGLGPDPLQRSGPPVADRFAWAALAADPGYIAPACD
jgi:hypothetical protein